MFRQLSLCPMMIAFIDDKQPVFPQPNIQTLREDGLIAVSQNITASMIINAYQNGIFRGILMKNLYTGLPHTQGLYCVHNG